eukprot:80363_1
MALDIEYSSIVSIVYFSINIVFLIGLAVIVYQQGGHEIKSKSYLKDLWRQRKIYGPLIIHFYDTATDIGVIYSWYKLLQDENDYDSVNMGVFVMSGVAFLAMYRFCLLCWSVFEWLYKDDGEWYYVLFVLCDLYIFVAVYESFSAAKGIITANAAKRLRNKEKRKQEKKNLKQENKKREKQAKKKREDEKTERDLRWKEDHKELRKVVSFQSDEGDDPQALADIDHQGQPESPRELKIDHRQTQSVELRPSSARNKQILETVQALQYEQSEEEPEEDAEIEPAKKQFLIQLGEAIVESMPQIVLQSVFVIRSANDPILVKEANSYLIMLSLTASLFSISNKYVYLDRDQVIEKAQSLKPRKRCPGCVQYLYVIRVIWRLFHVMSRFCVFVLIWTIMGGMWLPIATCSVFVYWIGIGIKSDVSTLNMVSYGTISFIGVYLQRDRYKKHMLLMSYKCIESLLGFSIITLFGMLSFDCSICADPVRRQIFNNANNRIFIFWTLGIASFAIDMILFLVMCSQNIFYPLYVFLKRESWKNIKDGNKITESDVYQIIESSKLVVSIERQKRIFASVMDNDFLIADRSSVGSGKSWTLQFVTREQYMNWIDALTATKLYKHILND